MASGTLRLRRSCRHLQCSGERGLHIVRQRSDSFDDGGTAVLPLDREGAARSRVGRIEGGKFQDNFRAPIYQRRGCKQLDYRPQLPNLDDADSINLQRRGGSEGLDVISRQRLVDGHATNLVVRIAAGRGEELVDAFLRCGFSGGDILLIGPPTGTPEEKRVQRVFAGLAQRRDGRSPVTATEVLAQPASTPARKGSDWKRVVRCIAGRGGYQ